MTVSVYSPARGFQLRSSVTNHPGLASPVGRMAPASRSPRELLLYKAARFRYAHQYNSRRIHRGGGPEHNRMRNVGWSPLPASALLGAQPLCFISSQHDGKWPHPSGKGFLLGRQAPESHQTQTRTRSEDSSIGRVANRKATFNACYARSSPFIHLR